MNIHSPYEPVVDQGRRSLKHLRLLQSFSKRVNANPESFYKLTGFDIEERIRGFIANVYGFNIHKLRYSRIVIPHRLDSMFCFLPQYKLVIEQKISSNNEYTYFMWVDLKYFLKYGYEQYDIINKEKEIKRHEYQDQLLEDITEQINKIKSVYAKS